MAHYHTAVELDATTVKIQNGGSMQTYKKVDLVVSRTHFAVYLKNKNVPTDAIVASWNAEQADDYGYTTLTDLENYLLNVLYGTAIPVPPAIQSYSAGVSDIDFTNTTAGVDSWEAKFFAVPTVGFISNANIVDFRYTISFFDGINPYLGISGNTSSTDVTFPILGNGIGVYYLSQAYNLDDGSIFTITKVIRVDAVGNILSSVIAKGVTINSVNGLNINCTANIDSINATVQYPTTWIGFSEFPPTNPPVVLWIGNILNTSVPINVEFIGFLLDISTDYPEVTPPFQLGALSTISIQ